MFLFLSLNSNLTESGRAQEEELPTSQCWNSKLSVSPAEEAIWTEAFSLPEKMHSENVFFRVQISLLGQGGQALDLNLGK